MQVVVAFDSRTGNTERAARLIGGRLAAAGATVSVDSIDEVDYKELAQADLVIVGTWTGGLFFFGQHPGGAGKIAATLPDLWDKPTYAYVTYAHNPGPAAEKMGEVLDAMGAVNLGSAAFHRKNLEQETATFVEGILTEFATS